MQEDVTMALGYGTAMHEILSAVHTPDDLENAVRQALTQGKITREKYDEVISLLSKSILSPDAEKWLPQITAYFRNTILY